MINELIEQIGGRERLKEISYRIDMYGHGAGYNPDEVGVMARALLAVLDAREKPRAMPDYQVYVGHKVFEDGCFRVVDMVELSVLEGQQEITRQLAAESNRMFDEMRAAGLRPSAMLAAAPAQGEKK